jgi:membrane fusion protein (multidrug efflux system)
MALLAVAMALGVVGCKKAAPPALPPPVVEVVTVTAGNAPASTGTIGQLDSPQNVEVRARVEAFVDKMLFTEGMPVKEGDLLFKLDEKPFVQRLNAAKAVLAESEAALAKYRTDTNRLTPLAKAKAIPLQDLDNAVASVAVGLANVESAEAQVESARIDLGYCDVKAAVTGLIGAKQVSIGELVGKGEPTLLATISTLDPIWFYCSVSEVDYLKAEAKSRTTGRKLADLPVTLLLADGSEHADKGKIVFIDRAVDIKTGTLRMRVEFPNRDKLLRPGMFARIKVDLGVRPDSIVIPERAIVELQGKNFVWVIGADDKASQRAIKLGDPVAGGVLIVDGLKSGDRIVVEGLQKVREGAAVKPMTAEEMKAAAPATAEAQHPKK